MPFQIIRNDISNVTADAIVNSTSPRPKIGYGVDSGIHKKAGPGLFAARMMAGNIPIGSAAVTGGFRLDTRYVIHTAAPAWQGGNAGEEAKLRSCYTRCLELAAEKNCRSIAFPLIGANNLGFPKAIALQIALGAIGDFLTGHEMEVSLVVFDRDSYRLSEALFQDVSSYIDENYVLRKSLEQYGLDDASGSSARQQKQALQQMQHRRMAEAQADHSDAAPLLSPEPEASKRMEAPPAAKKARGIGIPSVFTPSRPSAKSHKKSGPPPAPSMPVTAPCAQPVSDFGVAGLGLEDLLRQEDAGFSETVLRLIDESGKKDSEIYTKANISRQHFSKIRNNPSYKPTKPTAIALAIALELDLEQTRDLIGRAGYALTRSSKFDLIIMYFIQKKNYNLFDINATLFEFDQHLLGA